MKQLGPVPRKAMQLAMDKELSKWVRFGATKDVSDKELAALKVRLGKDFKIISTRWVLVYKDDGTPKARLVVIGCQERSNSIRSDAPTGSKESLMVVVLASSQSGWETATFDAASAYLQSGGIERTLLLKLPTEFPCIGMHPGQVVRATGSIYGTKDAGRAWYIFFRGVMFEHAPPHVEEVCAVYLLRALLRVLPVEDSHQPVHHG